MKLLIKIVIVIALVVLFGSVALFTLAWALDLLSTALTWLGRLLDWLGLGNGIFGGVL